PDRRGDVHGQRGRGAGRVAAGVGDNAVVRARIRRRGGGDGERGGGRTGDARAVGDGEAVLAPLIGQRGRAGGRDAEGRALTHAARRAGGLLADHRPRPSP